MWGASDFLSGQKLRTKIVFTMVFLAKLGLTKWVKSKNLESAPYAASFTGLGGCVGDCMVGEWFLRVEKAKIVL